MAKQRGKKTRIKKNTVIMVLLILIIGVCTTIYFTSNKGGNKLFGNDSDTEEKESGNEDKKEEKKLKIVDVNSKSRPYAVMINNNHEAWPQAGLQDAYMVYEIITEGGITRMLALYKDATTKSIGSTRSARHYFLDYALENDAIYVHYGWSPQAEADVSSLGVNNINGMVDGAPFWRDTSLKRASEHTVFTSIEKLKATASKKGYIRDSKRDLLLNYSIDEIDISQQTDAKIANSVSVKYSNYQTSSYAYNELEKVYYRSMSGVKNVDLITGKQYTVKNIIVIFVENYSIDSSGRQGLKNTGTGNGYYITDGYAVPIKWKKDSRSSQTVYSYVDGTEITVNDGNTYIQIQPKNQTLTIN